MPPDQQEHARDSEYGPESGSCAAQWDQQGCAQNDGSHVRYEVEHSPPLLSLSTIVHEHSFSLHPIVSENAIPDQRTKHLEQRASWAQGLPLGYSHPFTDWF